MLETKPQTKGRKSFNLALAVALTCQSLAYLRFPAVRTTEVIKHSTAEEIDSTQFSCAGWSLTVPEGDRASSANVTGFRILVWDVWVPEGLQFTDFESEAGCQRGAVRMLVCCWARLRDSSE